VLRSNAVGRPGRVLYRLGRLFVLLLPGSQLTLKSSGVSQLLRRRGGDLDDDVGWGAGNLCLETFLRVGGVGDRADESIGIDDAVATGDLVTITLFLTVLVVGELVVFHVETELVLRVGLRKNTLIALVKILVLS